MRYGPKSEFLERTGLECGQKRSEGGVICRDGGWYTKSGLVGWGDLNVKDLDNISKKLKEGECFFVLNAKDSLWRFTREIICKVESQGKPVRFFNLYTMNLNLIWNPGIEHLLKYSAFLVKKGRLYKIGTEYSAWYVVLIWTFEFVSINREILRYIVLGDTS